MTPYRTMAQHGWLWCLILALTVTAHAQATDPLAQVVSLNTGLLIREAPISDSDTIGQIAPGTLVSLIGRTNDFLWLQIRTPNNAEGWVASRYLATTADLAALPATSAISVFGEIAQFDDSTRARIQTIYRYGQQRGNHANVFAKVGDSITFAPHMLHPIGEGNYNLASFTALEDVIQHYLTGKFSNDNSFTRDSLATKIGWTTRDLLDPDEADTTNCEAGETPLACEYRILQPAVALIMLGTNDLGILTADAYYAELGRIVQITIESGIIPILSTIPNRERFEQGVVEYNQRVIFLAQAYHIPLWRYDMAMANLPNNGLDVDNAHPSIPPRGVNGAADFTPSNLFYGYVMRNLTALQMLDAVWRETEAIKVILP